MRAAVGTYAAERVGSARWMLGRFVVPVARLEEFEAASGGVLPFNHAVDEDAGDEAGMAVATAPVDDDPALAPWRLSALLGADVEAELPRVVAFNARHAPGAEAGLALVDVLEARAATPDDVGRLCAAVSRAGLRDVALYVELPWEADPVPYAEAAARAGARLKLRTGGVTGDAFPSPGTVLAFLQACAAAGVAGKCTAGLHHPLRGEQPLTYDADCARGTMYGFVGVFLAAALLHAGHAAADVAPLLEERDPSAFVVDEAAVTWRGLRADAATLADARARALVAFGSCSFAEPVHDLHTLGWWPG